MERCGRWSAVGVVPAQGKKRRREEEFQEGGQRKTKQVDDRGVAVVHRCTMHVEAEDTYLALSWGVVCWWFLLVLWAEQKTKAI